MSREAGGKLAALFGADSTSPERIYLPKPQMQCTADCTLQLGDGTLPAHSQASGLRVGAPSLGLGQVAALRQLLWLLRLLYSGVRL